MSAPTETTGKLLRRERERQGLTVQKVAEDLRLDRAVVEALEDGTYERSVPSVYARGHLRKYSHLLGMSFDDGQAAPFQPGGDEPLTAPALPGPRLMRIAPRVKKLPWARISIGTAIMLVLLLFWWSPWKHHVTVQAATSPVSLPLETASVALEPAPAPAPVQASEAVPPPAAPVDAPADLAVTGRVRLHLTFSATSWVEVRDSSGKRLFMGHGYPNTVKSIAGKAPFRIYIGSVSGAHVEINGREVQIDPTLVKGDIARFTVGTDGVLRPQT
jgi:cytoskeleton protein RodZ